MNAQTARSTRRVLTTTLEPTPASPVDRPLDTTARRCRPEIRRHRRRASGRPRSRSPRCAR